MSPGCSSGSSRATGVRATGVRATGVRATGVRATGVRATGVRATGVRAVGVRAIDWKGASLSLVPVAVVILLGALLAWPLRPSTSGSTRTTVALIQGNVPDIGLDFEDRPRQ